MKNFIEYLHKAHDNLSDLLGEQRTDWDDTIHVLTDEQLEDMGMEYALTHNASHTTPIYDI